jgi:hypothetical protein
MPSKIKVESITLNGSTKYMGGRIYYCNFNPSFSEKPNELQINVISDNGQYQTPSINFQTSVRAKIGNLDLGDMYPYKYKNTYSSQGNILQVSFIDPSFILDKIYIGLNSKHGWTDGFSTDMSAMNSQTFAEYLGVPSAESAEGAEGDEGSSDNTTKTSTPSNTQLRKKKTDTFWILGRLFHPCDVNKDNLIDHQEAFNVDPCDPCPTCPEDKYDNRCKELAYTTIFEVAYSFKDLIDAINEFQPKQKSSTITIEAPTGVSSNPIKYEKFYRDYHGNLREVLTSWANDFGLNWYYDVMDKKIKFIDISTQEIQVPIDEIVNKYKSDRLISYEHEVSAENTYQRGAISWYERGGERKSANCSKATTVVLSALYGVDYLGNRSRDTVQGNQINSNTDIVGAILRAYNPLLRDLFWTRKIYGITKSSEAMKYLVDIGELNSSSSSSSTQLGEFPEDGKKGDLRILNEMGNMSILAVVDCNLSKADKEKTEYQRIANAAWNDLVLGLEHTDKLTFVENSGFFIVAKVDEDLLAKRYEMEDELYSFIGKFFIRENLFRLCGMTGNEEFVKNNTNIESADGSANIYSKRDGIGAHPLSQYKYYKSGYLGCVVGTGNYSTIDPAKPVNNKKSTRENPEVNKEIPDSTQGFALQKGTVNNVEVVSLKNTPQEYTNAEGGNGMFSIKKADQTVPRFEQTAIILERTPKWIPEPQTFQENYNENLTKALGHLEWSQFGNGGTPPGSQFLEFVFGFGNTDAFKSGIMKKIKIFAVNTGVFEVYPAFQNDFGIKIKNPLDRIATEERKTLRRVGGKYSPLTPIGLLNNDCHQINLSGNAILKGLPSIITPPHTFVPETKKDLIEKDILSKTENKGGDTATSCDEGLKNERFRIPAYRVYVTQAFDQAVTLPKIQTGVDTLMKCADNVRRLDVLYNKFTDDDFNAFSGRAGGYGCVPNIAHITGMHDAYTGNAFSNTGADDTLSLEIKGLPTIQNYSSEIKKGLESFSIQISDQGISTTLQYSTKIIKGISPDLLKFQNSRSFDRMSKGI